MLNISANSINKHIDQNSHEAFKKVNQLDTGNAFKKTMIVFFMIGIVVLCLPWTQNIRSNGNVTTLKPNQRPQTVHSVIAGRIEKWFVKEGDYVNKGDTILFISEVKDAYFDPNLLSRTDDQVKAKEFSVASYKEKVIALNNQVSALQQTAKLKLQQTQNKYKQAQLKVKSDSIDLKAAELNAEIGDKQFERLKQLYNDGLKSLTDLENRKNKMREAQAKLISAENKLLTSKNELINAQVELLSVKAEYEKEIAKAKSEKYTALSSQYDAEISATKLRNEYTNYEMRNNLHYVLAPQNGYITKAIQVGLGETFKEGSPIISIMPSEYSLAVELYINPIDLPLVDIGQEVRIQFDGWPAIVFSGWPNTSYGTYGGTVFAIDKFISENGKFRVLVKPDKEDYGWPEALRVGGGTNIMMLLKEVPIWYELWRQINGFPPDFYKSSINDLTIQKKSS